MPVCPKTKVEQLHFNCNVAVTKLKMVRILLADDHQIVRSGLKMVIESLFLQVDVDEAWDGESALRLIKARLYDLIILDVSMPKTDSFGLVANILAHAPSSKILICSMNAEEVYAKKYIQSGASGYLSKKSTSAEIKDAITMVLDGRKYISPALANKLTEQALGTTKGNLFDSLSAREFEILQHLVRGASVGEISRTLSLHTSTVGTHKGRIFEKLKVRNLVELNELAKVHNVIPL
jgi:DNA-binding NarL/FixJ family response regulator